MSPIQKVGTEKPSTENAMIDFDRGLSGRYPAYIPSGMPSSVAPITAASVISRVAGRRDRMRPSTGVL